MVKVIRERLRPKGIPVFYIIVEKEGFEFKLVNALGLFSVPLHFFRLCNSPDEGPRVFDDEFS